MAGLGEVGLGEVVVVEEAPQSGPISSSGSLGMLGWLFSFWYCCRDGPSILLGFSFLSSELPVPLSSREGSSRGGCLLPPTFVKG